MAVLALRIMIVPLACRLGYAASRERSLNHRRRRGRAIAGAAPRNLRRAGPSPSPRSLDMNGEQVGPGNLIQEKSRNELGAPADLGVCPITKCCAGLVSEDRLTVENWSELVRSVRQAPDDSID